MLCNWIFFTTFARYSVVIGGITLYRCVDTLPFFEFVYDEH
jgi:hypothetical protein